VPFGIPNTLDTENFHISWPHARATTDYQKLCNTDYCRSEDRTLSPAFLVVALGGSKDLVFGPIDYLEPE